MSRVENEGIVPALEHRDNIEPEDDILEKTHNEYDEITAASELAQATEKLQHGEAINDEMRQRLGQYYGHKAEQDGVAVAADVVYIMDKIIEMSEERAMEILLETIVHHSEDVNFPSWTMEKIQQLSKGYKAGNMDPLDWSFDLKAEAAMIYYHSPYPEVRAVTDPFDDPTIPVETIRAYALGLIFMAGSSAMNTFFSPRQPAISLSANVLQLILAPCGQASARFLPDWGFTFMGTRYSLNPGPWDFKEQLFATIMFSIANGAGATYYTYLVQMLPQYLGQTWVTFGYEILLALYVQFAGFGFAGILRRFVIYPQTAIWPSVLPTLALNRTLIQKEKREVINGWRWTRYKFFLIMFVAQFVWFWIPNTFFTALHGFNWMTWIAPHNFNLGMVTGFYGGMGFNPWATFDWNVSGTGALVTPFYSQAQQYLARVLSGIFITAAYYSNFVWAAYMPINSNETFDNKGKLYNLTRIMGSDGYVNVTAYKEYSPPYYSGANVFGQGNYLAWYALTLTYVVIRNWPALRNAAVNMWKSLRFGSSVYDGNDDAHTRMMRAYPEVPDWWFIVILLVSNAMGIAALEAYPTHTPWWSILAVMGINLVMLIPNAFLIAVANIHTSLGVLFKMLAGVWFAGNPIAMVIMQAVGPAFDVQTDSYMSDQKIAHYAKLPPRAIFRCQLLAVFVNCFIFIGILNWMVNDYNDGTLCTWDNQQHFVCSSAVLVYASSVMYGAFGVRNLFKLYPIIPWGLLLGAFTGCAFAFGQKYGRRFVQWAQLNWSEERYAWWDSHLFTPFSSIYWFNPAVCWAGALTWTGGNNLSYATNGMYVSYIFMYHIKRRYPAWWRKYNYLLEAAFDIGVAVSGTVQTLAFGFSGKKFPKWWGNKVATAGVDYQSYNQKAPLLPIPEKGYFGLDPDQFPLAWPQSVKDGKRK